MAQITVAVSDGDGAAVVAAGGVELEAGELVAADGGAGAAFAELRAGGAGAVGVRCGVAVRAVAVCGGVTVAVGRGLGALADAAG